MQIILPYEAELLRHKPELIRRFSKGTNHENHDVNYTSSIFVETLFNRNLDIIELRREKFNECVEAYKEGDLETIEQSVLRILGLGQAQDYVPAILWLGAFSEKILENFEEAAYYYRRAASFDSGIGMYCYGILLLNKKAFIPANVSVKRCFTDAAARGISEAEEILSKYWNE